ncbi:MAG: CHRD domain-containing protein [Planctomycetes bacterium]|nr:CHRD domain-containing protein [Planctomycetota bacterium]
MNRNLLCGVVVTLSLAWTAATAASGKQSEAFKFVAHCTGGQEVPARTTNASGQAVFRLTRDEAGLSYRLQVANIHNVVAAHIHSGAPGENGPIVAFLYGPAPAGGGRTNGVLATGTILAGDLIGPLEGQPLSALLDAMNAGQTYVNVHTNDGADPTDTGAGDFPGGEIRGQIMPAGR